VTEATRADIFINLSEAEGLCIVVAEAMLAGLPVVAVHVGGIRDYGRDGENMPKLGRRRLAARAPESSA
jgi:glycosyltransferase involved in cell wall biosynthesis